VLVEQRNHDQLAKTARCPGSPEDSKTLLIAAARFDADHQPFAANRPDQFVTARHFPQKSAAAVRRVACDRSTSRSDSITCKVASPDAIASAHPAGGRFEAADNLFY